MNPETSRTFSESEPSVGARRLKAAALWALTAVILALAASTVVFVDETEYVTIERFGHIVAVYDRAEDRGLHFKLPWPVSTVRRFDRRAQLFDPPGREMFTRDKKNITVDAFVCWKIAEPQAADSTAVGERPVVRFYRSLGSLDVAEARLESRIRSILSTHIGQVELSSLLSVADSESGPDSSEPGLLERISDAVRKEVFQRPEEDASIRDRLGIEIVDVRIKRINFPLGNQQAVFERMKSERRKIADRYRSAGMAENTVIKSQADRQYAEILAKAEADAERIRGAAEAEAISILNRAHAQDPEFYRVVRTLDTYRKILNERTTLVLSASSNLLKMLSEGLPVPDNPASPQTAPAPTADAKTAIHRAPAESPASPAAGDGAAAEIAADGPPNAGPSAPSDTSLPARGTSGGNPEVTP